MNQEEISRIRADVLASDPNLSKDVLTDAAIEAAAKRVLPKADSETIAVDAIAQPDVPQVAKTTPDVVAQPLVVETEVTPDQKDIMNAVLADLQGNAGNVRIDNPDLAGFVDQVLKMDRKD